MSAREHDCPTCICGRRAPVQGEHYAIQRDDPRHKMIARRGPGTIAWQEHLLAWSGYAARYGTSQSAEEIAGRRPVAYGRILSPGRHEQPVPSPWCLHSHVAKSSART